MIKKLQHKFIAISVLAVAALVILIEIPFLAVSFYNIRSRVDARLNYIIRNDGLPEYEDFVREYGSDEEWDTEAETGRPDEGGGAGTEKESALPGEEAGTEAESAAEGETEEAISGLEGGIRSVQDVLKELYSLVVSQDDRLDITPESAYQLRYFVVVFDEDGEIEETGLTHVAAVSESSAARMATLVARMHRRSGYLAYGTMKYYFRKVKDGSGETSVWFLDCTSELNSFADIQGVSVLVGVMVVILFLIIVTLVSHRAMKPYIDNMDRQKEFITNAGHELKTPLTIISANAEVLEMINGKNEWTESISHQVRRMTGLINELVSLARMSETQDLTLENLDFSAIVKDSAESFRPVIEQRGCTLETAIDEGLQARAEPRMLTELVNILVDNAGKYCDEGGSVSITLAPKGAAHRPCLTVSNSFSDGEGVDTSRFFQRFYRGDSSHNSGKSGHGIGLSMAENIAENFRGKITAEWKNGRMIFTVLLQKAAEEKTKADGGRGRGAGALVKRLTARRVRP